jgi:Tryptophan halogenase
MKIGIIGAGTASAVSLISMLHVFRERRFNDYEIVCIADPKIPITHVGESLSSLILLKMIDVLDFDFVDDLIEIDGTLRIQSRAFWERANGHDFKVKYGLPGLHVNSEKFSKFVIDRILKLYPNVSIVYDNVEKIIDTDDGATLFLSDNKSVDFTFVINCTGTPTAEELAKDYEVPEFISVNAAILYPDFKKYDEMFTSSYVHDNGWMFGVPLQHRKAFGYCYNNNITSKEEAIKDFSEIKNIDASTCRSFEWSQYYRKKIIERSVLYLGNKLYFLEPQQGLPLHFYGMMITAFTNELFMPKDINTIRDEFNRYYRFNIENVQDLIALNYSGECNIDSKFWNYVKEPARQRLKNSEVFQNWLSTCEKENKLIPFWFFDEKMIKAYIEGYKIDLGELRCSS